MNSKNIMRSLSIAAATLATTAVFADPFSGLFVEGGLGASQLKSEGRNVQVITGTTDGIANFNVGDISLRAQKDTGFAGRLGIGYAYTFPANSYTPGDTNFNLAGLLTYNVASQKLKDSVVQFSGRGIANGNSRNADSGGWTTEMKNAIDLRVQPGYYVLPLRTLFYGTLGYARAKLEVSGQDVRTDSANDGGSGVVAVGTGSTDLNGWVLGLGAKFSPIARLYVGFDYSHTSYKSKSISGQSVGNAAINGVPQRGTIPVTWQSDTGKIKTDTYLLTAGYYFF